MWWISACFSVRTYIIEESDEEVDEGEDEEGSEGEEEMQTVVEKQATIKAASLAPK